ncbi:MAG TPA: SAM-dependent methyltransferase [Kofleriaceae bacterium]|nr:SAM-dependent methyltransferase [Kofleriaceae bacterium]
MRDDTPSRTAAWVAAARQLGRLLPASVRLVDDPFGAAFTSARLCALIEDAVADDEPDPSRQLATALRRIKHPLVAMPGLRQWILYMQVRTRVIDDALDAFVARGGRQVVLLGAGYDCRALRMPALADARVFEVDHPATQRHKRAVLDELAQPSPSHYVTWDFEQRPVEDLPDALAEAGHDRAAPTFTIWEGVTMYLSESTIDASLRAIVEWSAPDSELAMTYFAKARLERPSLATRAVRAVVSTFGEPWRFGWKPDELPAYLRERGLELVRDVSLAGAARELLPGELAAHVSDDDRRVAFSAVVPEAIAVART